MSPRSLYEAFALSAQKHSQRPALAGDGGRGKKYTYGEAYDAVRVLAGGLTAGDFSDQVEIGLLSENRPEWPLTYLAILGAGKTVVPLDANLQANELAELIERAGLKTLFVSDKFISFARSLPGDMRMISFETDWDSLSDSEASLSPVADLDAPAALIYTSGTTGDPKAVVLTHRNLLSNLESIRLALQFGPDDTFMSVLPLHHTFEATCGFLTPLMSGCYVVYARSLKSNEILEDIASNRATVMCGVPLLFEKMHHGMVRKIKQAPVLKRTLVRLLFGLSAFSWRLGARWGRPLFKSLRHKAGLNTMRMFVSGGAALPPNITRYFNLLGFNLLQGYGLTETSPVIAVNRPDSIRFDTVGLPLDGVEVRLHEVNENGVGEIVVRGENITPGYRNSPEATAELIHDGWLHTGDLGCWKGDHLCIVGRAKNLIVSAAGKNIYPEEIEARLLASDFVLEAVVYGRPKEGKQGEDVCAVIVPDTDQFEDARDRAVVEAQIAAAVKEANQLMADFKRVNHFEVQYEELIKTSTRKVKRSIYNEYGKRK